MCSKGSVVMTACNQRSHLHVLKWEACEKRQDGTDPVTLFLQVTGLIDINNKNERNRVLHQPKPPSFMPCRNG